MGEVVPVHEVGPLGEEEDVEEGLEYVKTCPHNIYSILTR
jgi:hypothetical protein